MVHYGNYKVTYLMPHEQWNSVQNARVMGAFVTTDENYAKFFALNRCISGGGQVKLANNKIYLERLADKIKPHFYVYTVYKTPDSVFIHDKGTEYYSETPIKIAKVRKCDTAAELDKLGYEIYVMDEPFNANYGQFENRTDNFARQNYMANAIQQSKFHRVDIGKLLQQQKKNSFKTAKNDLNSKLQQLLNWLRNLDHGHA